MVDSPAPPSLTKLRVNHTDKNPPVHSVASVMFRGAVWNIRMNRVSLPKKHNGAIIFSLAPRLFWPKSLIFLGGEGTKVGCFGFKAVMSESM